MSLYGGAFPFLNGPMDVFRVPVDIFFSTLPRTKLIEIDSRVPILSLRVHQPKAHSNPTVGQPHNQISSAPSNTEPFGSSSPAFDFGPLVVLSTAGVHQIFDSLLARKGRSTEQRSSTHQCRECTTLGHNPTYIRKTKTSWLPHPKMVGQRPYTILLPRTAF